MINYYKTNSPYEDKMTRLIQNMAHTDSFEKNRELDAAIDRYNKLPKWRKIFFKNPSKKMD